MKQSSVEAFRRLVYDYYHRHERELPWRATRDPYLILVSEIMLQQTQSQRVIPKYEQFLRRFPTVNSLASASLLEVLQLWQGLGYNRRGKYLHEAAKTIVGHFGGKVPTEIEELLSLPGIGPYTSAAIVAFAYGRPVTLIETNVRRVYIHHFFSDSKLIHDREILPLIAETIDHDDPRNWYYALMDYGSHLRSLVANPNRQSAHYQRQSTFAGSVRQVRGAIIRLLSDIGETNMDHLRRGIDAEPERFRDALRGLQRDGMLEVNERTVRLSK